MSEQTKSKVKNICMCIRNDIFWTPLASSQNYKKAAKKILKHAKRRTDIEPKQLKRLIKDIKKDIEVASMIISELKVNADPYHAERKLLK